MKHAMLMMAFVCACSFVVAELPQPAFQVQESVLLQTVRESTKLDERVTACQELAHRGSAASVAPLVALLAEETPMPLFHAVRYALENIPDSSVDTALLSAATRLTGLRQVGVCQSLGNRACEKSVPILGRFLDSEDPKLRGAAARALGKIKTDASAAVLKTAVKKCPCAAEAYLTVAGSDPAVCRYLQEQPALSPSLRNAALRGYLLAAPEKESIQCWMDSIRKPEWEQTALRTLGEMKASPAFAQAISSLLREKLPIRQNLCDALCLRPSLPVSDVLLSLARGEFGASEQEKVSALWGLVRRADVRVQDLLLESALQSSPISEVAKKMFVALNTPQVNAYILALAKSPKANVRKLGAELIGARRMRDAKDALLLLSDDADTGVRSMAQNAMGDLAEKKDLGVLLDLLQKRVDDARLLRAISLLCAREMTDGVGDLTVVRAVYGAFDQHRVQDVTQAVQQLLKAGSRSVYASNRLCGLAGFSHDPAPGHLKTLRLTYRMDGVERSVLVRENETAWLGRRALPVEMDNRLQKRYEASTGAFRSALLHIYERMGTDAALKVVREAAQEASTQEQAIRALCEWNGTDAAEDVERLAGTAPTERLRVLAFRGAVRMLSEAFALTPEQKVARYGALAAKAVRDADRKQALALQQEEQEKLDAVGTGFPVIFNGKDLTGWEATNGYWSVQNGILTGESKPGHLCKPNHHVVWRGAELTDFDLVLEARLSRHANSGIQIRSNGQLIGDNGYQADMDGGGNYPGFIYHPRQHLVGERGAVVKIAADGKKTVERFADGKELAKLYRIEQWNTFRVRCQGRAITVWVNGTRTCHLEDARESFFPKKGFLTLQLHQGPPMKVEFRNIRLKQL